MPIKFVEEKKRQKYLIMVFVAVALTSAVVVWQGYFKKEELSPTPGFLFREIKIKFDVLEGPVLKELQPFEEISLEGLLPFETNIGRENPFISY